VKLFVLIYDRSEQRLVDIREFEEGERPLAEAFRLTAQRQSLREKLDQEIVLFQAPSREALKRTHGSYFLSEKEMLERTIEVAKAS
jgi:hypothetical protein